MKLDLNMQNLSQLDDGRIAAAFDAEIRNAVNDMLDRPGDDRAREVTIKLQMKPICDEGGYCENVTVKADIGSKIPSRKSRAYSMMPSKTQRGGALAFNEMSLDNVNQESLPIFPEPNQDDR